jgi:hypothetical protein
MASQIKNVANPFIAEIVRPINVDAGFSQPGEHERTQFPRPLKTRHAEQYKRDIRQNLALINWLRLGSFFGFETIENAFGVVPGAQPVLSLPKTRWTPGLRRDIFDPVWQHSL